MKLHWLQHVPFEGLGMIETWARARHAEISQTRFFAGDPLPDSQAFDGLVIMGGPMGIHDHGEYPWLADEKRFIKQAIEAGRTVLGICLGAQLIADALGAQVYPGPQQEIGWFPIRRTKAAAKLLPEELTVFHWHGDTFDIPAGAVLLAASAAYPNQGFIYEDRVVGLQFHMETTAEGMEALIENCGAEPGDSPFVQSEEQMRAGLSNIETIHHALERLLDSLQSKPLPFKACSSSTA